MAETIPDLDSVPAAELTRAVILEAVPEVDLALVVTEMLPLFQNLAVFL